MRIHTENAKKRAQRLREQQPALVAASCFRFVFSIRCSVNLFSKGECMRSCLSHGEIIQRAGCPSGRRVRVSSMFAPGFPEAPW